MATIVALLVATAAAGAAQLTARSVTHRVAAADSAASRLLADLLNAETGQRGYLLTGRPQYLSPYESGSAAVRTGLDDVARRVAGWPEVAREVRPMRGLAASKLQEMAETVRLARAGRRHAAERVVASNRGQRYMDGLRRRILRMHSELARRSSAAGRRADDGTAIAIAVSALLCVLLLVLVERWRVAAARARRERLATERERERTLVQLAEAQRIARLGSWSWDRTTAGPHCTPEAAAIYALDPVGQPRWRDFMAVVHPDDRDEVRRAFARLRDEGGQLDIDHRVLTPAGEERFVHMLGREDPIAPVRIVGTVQDVTERKRLEEQLRHHAQRDPLTSLFNRRRFREELERTVADHVRHGSPATLVLCDLDGLKLINDALGHRVGDDVIRAVSAALQSGTRPGDIVARMGGDEFAVLLRHTEADRGIQTAERLRGAVRELQLHAGGQRLRVTLSVGLIGLCDGLTAEDALGGADAAMYEAKRSGRDRVVLARDVPAGDPEELGWIQRLHAALEEDRFELYAQPIVGLADGAPRHRELLLRLRDDDGELLLPGAFVPTAERAGLIVEIDRWVVRHAIALIAEDEDAASAYAVNLSGLSVGDPELLALIADEIGRAGIDPRRLIVEFTETAAIRSLDAARAFANGLTAIGCRSALDDFGSGYGSFSYLKHLPVQYVKIDGEFVRNLPASPEDRALVTAIVEVARALGKETVAEHVGGEETVALLRELGVDYAQGFHVGRPRPVAMAAV